MQIIPVINCDDFQCVKDRLVLINEFTVSAPKMAHIDISDGIYAREPQWNDPHTLKNFITDNNFNFNISVHFMTRKPCIEITSWFSLIVKATIPIDCHENIRGLADFCHEKNILPSLSIPPSCTIEEALKYSDYFNEFQILAVSPGPAGQQMSEGTLAKIKLLRNAMPSAIIEVDGGVNPNTAPSLKTAGADIILSGSYIFNSADPRIAYYKLQSVS